MQKRNLFWLLLFIVMSFSVYGKTNLTHIQGINSIGLRAGTGFGNSWDVGLSYNYYWAKYWSFSTNIDFEKGKFEKSDFMGLSLSTGVEAAVWQPLTWMYLHLYGHAIIGWDWWNNSDMSINSNGVTVGCDLGLNLEMYVIPELSFVLSAQENFNYGFYYTGHYYYFRPLFSTGMRFHIK